MKQKVRWGILGVARINARVIPAIYRARNAEVYAIASRSQHKAEQAARDWSIARAYGSYEALLEDPDVDAVYIPLPNALHGMWTMRAAEQGKHVLCEKPLAKDAAEAQQMVEVCKRHGVLLMDGFFWPHHPRTARLRHLLDRGAIGRVQLVVGAFTFQLPLDPANIRLQPGLAGGCVMDIGCYPIYGARWVFGGEPQRVYAVAQWYTPHQSEPVPQLTKLAHLLQECVSCVRGLDDAALEQGLEAIRQRVQALAHSAPGAQESIDLGMQGMLEFEAGRVALFDCSFTMPFRGKLEIVGSEGVIEVPEMWLPPARATLIVHREGRQPEEIVVEGEDQIVHMIERFSQAVLEEGEAPVPPEQAVQTMRVLDAVRAAARQGQPVVLQRA